MLDSKSDGIYAKASDVVRMAYENEKPVVDKEDISKSIMDDVMSMPVNKMAKMCADAISSVALYQMGYYSVIRGQKKYIHPEYSKNPELIIKVINNLDISIEEKKAAKERVKCMFKKNKNIPAGQYVFDDDMNITEVLSVDELMDLLTKVANK